MDLKEKSRATKAPVLPRFVLTLFAKQQLSSLASGIDNLEENMANENLKGLKVAILIEDGFEQVEMVEPRKALDQAGAETRIVSTKNKSVRGWKFKEWGDEFPVDLPIDQAQPRDFDALLLPGGVINPDKLRMQPKAVEFVKAFFDAGKPVASICHGPWTVIEAGAARGRRIASWPSLKTDLRNAGAEWVDQEAVVDGNLVTSRNPDDIPAFNREMIALFSQQSRRQAQRT
jgi:protease I